jgi:hypothetical protein
VPQQDYDNAQQQIADLQRQLMQAKVVVSGVFFSSKKFVK